MPKIIYERFNNKSFLKGDGFEIKIPRNYRKAILMLNLSLQAKLSYLKIEIEDCFPSKSPLVGGSEGGITFWVIFHPHPIPLPSRERELLEVSYVYCSEAILFFE